MKVHAWGKLDPAREHLFERQGRALMVELWIGLFQGTTEPAQGEREGEGGGIKQTVSIKNVDSLS